jgi:phosphonate transport system ATP-binding protein
MINIKDLNHTYKNSEEGTLKNINLIIKKGERVAFLGPSGSGKTTLINCINRLIEPTSGSILINDKDILKVNKKELKDMRKKIAIIFQGFNLIERNTVLKNVLNGRLGYIGTLKTFFNKFSEEDYQIAEESLKSVGLLHKKNERINNLSGGQKQRVAIARALCQCPEIILADEPVSNLDPKLIREILLLLQKICKEKQITLITSLHFVELIKGNFQRMIGITDGEILFDDLLESDKPESYNQFSSYYQDQLIKKRLKELGYLD